MSVEDKADRLVREGKVHAIPSETYAVEGDHGTYLAAWLVDTKKWICTCETRGAYCSHIEAARRVATHPDERRSKRMSYTTFERRQRLLAWLKEVDGRTLSARQIVNMSGIYDEVRYGTRDRCFDDLKVLHERGLVGRKGRPATWWAI